MNSLSGTSAAERLRPRPKRVLSVPRGLVGAGASFLSAPCAASQAQLKQAVGNFFSKPKDVPPGVTLRHGRLWTPTKPGEEEKKFERGRPKRPEPRGFCPNSSHRTLLAPGRAAAGGSARSEARHRRLSCVHRRRYAISNVADPRRGRRVVRADRSMVL